MWEFISERRASLAFDAYQHTSLVLQCVLLATVIAVVAAALITRAPRLEPVANAVSAIGLTLPSLALIGLLIPLSGLGTTTAVVAVTFYAVMPILRNAVVGFAQVDATLLESARGMGMSELRTLTRIRLPLAWPVILAGVRVSTQMSMGVAAIAAYVIGPGLGKYIFTGLATDGGANSVNNAVVGTFGIVLIALVADALLLLLGRLTISKGIRA
ncbi:osmoprotectant transport system permease protein [Nocardioides sp. J9]|uniref:ABC transporter permease n=1 Tax=unclassified Nocardioides TaxID=2615069 RepID=UPI00048F93B2|nr:MULTISPECIES: ABC transporter permease [unclassified Nocardioides]TWH01981.1 osmoprotectant transport system permease protein [Nocardioides sp. J9]